MKKFLIAVVLAVTAGAALALFAPSIDPKAEASTAETMTDEHSVATDAFIQQYLDQHYPVKAEWKVVGRDRWSVITPNVSSVETDNPPLQQIRQAIGRSQEMDRVIYVIEDRDGERMEYKPCMHNDPHFVVGDTIIVSRTGKIVGPNPECSLDTYRKR